MEINLFLYSGKYSLCVCVCVHFLSLNETESQHMIDTSLKYVCACTCVHGGERGREREISPISSVLVY
jgi:hypothetical protein